MRILLNFIGLCFFLLGGGQYLHANTHPSVICDSPSWSFVKNHQIKLKIAEPSNVLIEEADVDLDEEFHSSDDVNKSCGNKNILVNHSLLNSWYLTFSSKIIFKDCSKNNKIFPPNCGYSDPIYLRIGVLRI